MRRRLVSGSSLEGGRKMHHTGGRDDNARGEAGAIRSSVGLETGQALWPRLHARNVRTIKADIGQFAIAKSGTVR